MAVSQVCNSAVYNRSIHSELVELRTSSCQADTLCSSRPSFPYGPTVNVKFSSIDRSYTIHLGVLSKIEKITEITDDWDFNHKIYHFLISTKKEADRILRFAGQGANSVCTTSALPAYTYVL